MRKWLEWIAVIIVFAVGISFVRHLATEGKRPVDQITITVYTPDRMPIPYAVVLLKMLEKNVDIRVRTDGTGKVIFQKLTQGTYSIHAAKVYCAGGAKGAEVLILTIDKPHGDIFYYPCGQA